MKHSLPSPQSNLSPHPNKFSHNPFSVQLIIPPLIKTIGQNILNLENYNFPHILKNFNCVKTTQR